MKTGGIGGANTKTGLIYEGKVDLRSFLNQQPGYHVDGNSVFFQGEEVAQIFKKQELYSQFLAPRGSVDEKLQTCDFKKKQYQKLFFPLNIEVQYAYILDDWFRNPKYKDVLDYIISVGCQYYFQYIPLQRLGLPVPISD